MLNNHPTLSDETRENDTRENESENLIDHEVNGSEEQLSRVKRKLDPMGMIFDIAFIIDGTDANELKKKAVA